jgi:hypothetical protein
MAVYKNEWHVWGITGDMEDITSVVGSEHNCRMVARLMVSSGQWDNAWIYPPGSNSDETARIPVGPHEVYTVPNMGGVQGTESHSIEWRGWERTTFNDSGNAI